MKGITAIRWSRALVTLTTAASVAAGALLAWAAPPIGQPGARAGATTRRGAPAVDPAVAAYQRARALYEQEDYAGAAEEARRALELNPNLSDAKIVRQVSLSKLAAATRTGAATGPGVPVKLLTPEQISALRLAELQDNETGLQGRVDRKTLELFWNEVIKPQKGVDTSRAAYDAFMNPANISGQVAAIKASNLQAYIDKIVLTSDPANMIAFKQTVHPFVLQTCATATCHGGVNAGDLRLVRPAAAVNNAILYTNFYRLTTYTTKNGDRVINRDEPRKSLLLQYALPKSVAALPHPGKVEAPRRLADEKAPEFVAMESWVRSLTFPTPVYHLPGMEPVTTGAASQAAGPVGGRGK